MSWKGAAGTPPYGASGISSSNVPDYQKMLQHHIFSSGYGNSVRQATSADRYRTTSYNVSPPRTVSPPLSSRTTDTYNYKEPHIYQSYQPSKYGVSMDNHYDVPYKKFGELNMDDTVHYLNKDGHSKTMYNSMLYDFQKFDTDSYRTDKPNYDLLSTKGTKTMPDYDLERPLETDLDWTSPKKASAEFLSKTSNLSDYGRGKESIGQATEDLYSTNRYMENGDAHVSERQSLPTTQQSKDDYKSATDLTNWQKHHQDKFVQQHIDNESSSMYGRYDDTEDRPGKWKSVKQAADAIISEKDMLIDKLRMQNMQLEMKNKENDTKLRLALINESDQESLSYKQIKELEMKNTSLKSELMELKSKQNSEKEDLEIKLGAVEHEVVELRTALRKRNPHYDDQINFKVDHLEEEKDEWKNKFLEMRDSYHKIKKKADDLEHYISDFPTPEEIVEHEQQMRQYQQENETHKQRVAELEQKLFENRKLLSSREMEIESLEEKRQQLDQRVNDLSEDMYQIKSVGQGAALQQREEELRKTLEDNRKFSADLEKAKKLIEIGHMKVRQLEAKHGNTVKHLQERLNQEEEMVNALREESRVKEEHALKFKKSHKQLASQNQDLMEQNLVLQEQVKHFEEQTTDETQQLQRQFLQELGVCFSELQAVVHICMQRAEGQDPNMSMLLGVKGPPPDFECSASSKTEAKTIKQWLRKVKELRNEVETLRGSICNKYAEDLGDNLNCTQQ